uniref:Uncharacterized protein n=1 Tax=Rhizophora mucronata TaxID=61149 RepID=A0A2P2PX70_RHIMU
MCRFWLRDHSRKAPKTCLTTDNIQKRGVARKLLERNEKIKSHDQHGNTKN